MWFIPKQLRSETIKRLDDGRLGKDHAREVMFWPRMARNVVLAVDTYLSHLSNLFHATPAATTYTSRYSRYPMVKGGSDLFQFRNKKLLPFFSRLFFKLHRSQLIGKHK